MDAITDTLSNTTISTVYSKKKFNQHLRTNNLSGKYITEFTIPDGITEIGEYAFLDCTSLTSINIPNGVTKIGKGAFRDCRSLTSINIPASVTEIGVSAFLKCSSLTSINITDGVTGIGEYAFLDCTSLTSINIPSSVTEIGEGTFRDCTSLTSISIPDAVTKIGPWAFLNCRSLTSINIPDSVTEIGQHAFNGCTNLAVIICNNPVQFVWSNIGINTTQIQIISYQEHLTSNHANIITATNLTDLNNDESYLIYRLISELEFNPSWQVLETTFNERSLPQIKRLLQNIDKNTEHLPIQMIFFRGVKIPTYIEEFLSIADRSSLFGQAQRTIDIRPREQEPAAQQQAPSCCIVS
jgi:hypothetical protein